MERAKKALSAFKSDSSQNLAAAAKIQKKHSETEQRLRELEGIREAHDALLKEVDEKSKQCSALKTDGTKSRHELESTVDTLDELKDAIGSLIRSGLATDPADPSSAPAVPPADVMSPLRPRGASAAALPPQAPLPLTPTHLHLHAPRDPSAKAIWDAGIAPLVVRHLRLSEEADETRLEMAARGKTEKERLKLVESLKEKLEDANGKLSISDKDLAAALADKKALAGELATCCKVSGASERVKDELAAAKGDHFLRRP